MNVKDNVQWNYMCGVVKCKCEVKSNGKGEQVGKAKVKCGTKMSDAGRGTPKMKMRILEMSLSLAGCGYTFSLYLFPMHLM